MMIEFVWNMWYWRVGVLGLVMWRVWASKRFRIIIFWIWTWIGHNWNERNMIWKWVIVILETFSDTLSINQSDEKISMTVTNEKTSLSYLKEGILWLYLVQKDHHDFLNSGFLAKGYHWTVWNDLEYVHVIEPVESDLNDLAYGHYQKACSDWMNWDYVVHVLRHHFDHQNLTDLAEQVSVYLNPKLSKGKMRKYFYHLVQVVSQSDLVLTLFSL